MGAVIQNFPISARFHHKGTKTTKNGFVQLPGDLLDAFVTFVPSW